MGLCPPSTHHLGPSRPTVLPSHPPLPSPLCLLLWGLPTGCPGPTRSALPGSPDRLPVVKIRFKREVGSPIS